MKSSVSTGFVFPCTVPIHGKESRALLFNQPLTQDHWHQLAVSQQVWRTCFPLLSKEDIVSLATESVWLGFFFHL